MLLTYETTRFNEKTVILVSKHERDNGTVWYKDAKGSRYNIGTRIGRINIGSKFVSPGRHAGYLIALTGKELPITSPYKDR